MPDEAQQTQNDAAQNAVEKPVTTQKRSSEAGNSSGDGERSVPYHRFQELNQTNKQLKAQLDEIRAEQERVEEERAQKQGEYQKLADKYKSQAQTEKEKRQQLEANWERERRLNVWVGAAAGIVKQEAVIDAFSMLDEDDFANVDSKDDKQMKRLAEMLVERKPYLADGPVGAGSGGSERPILGNVQSSEGGVVRRGNSEIPMTSSGRFIFKQPNKRRSWK